MAKVLKNYWLKGVNGLIDNGLIAFKLLTIS